MTENASPPFQRSASSGRFSARAAVVGFGAVGGVEDRGARLGALGWALGHESFERDAYDLGLDAALGVGLAERGGDFRGGARFALLGEVAADEFDRGGPGRLRSA
ncbi:hypothetical protein GCM10027162_08600 [Streptomyces incanus]